ncbi:SMI1/KNR4 family protein [Coleofasciculus sp. E1-EBD-02]|uniref:SMI1/KNR4 family protein n=1 Tax=Coleofasciculus sp. E1-EBD-02 TaxID=3068481 RepID=UPI0032F891D6
MNNDNVLVNLLMPYENQGWTPARPTSEEAIVAVENKLQLNFPDLYRKLLLYSDGGELEIGEAFINLFDSDYLRELNPHPVWSTGLPGMVFFGDDQGDYLYYFDPKNRLGHGNWAVYGVSMGSCSVERSMYLAQDITHLFRRILNGEDVLSDSYLKDE